MGMNTGIQLGSAREIRADVHMCRRTVPHSSGVFFLCGLIYDRAGNSDSSASNSRKTAERRTGHRYETKQSWPLREDNEETPQASVRIAEVGRREPNISLREVLTF
jgi:hypothetical protein